MRYGDGGTVHQSGEVNVELDSKGKVVAVWFRCAMLPFTQNVVDKERAKDMRAAYKQGGMNGIVAVEFSDQPYTGRENEKGLMSQMAQEMERLTSDPEWTAKMADREEGHDIGAGPTGYCCENGNFGDGHECRKQRAGTLGTDSHDRVTLSGRPADPEYDGPAPQDIDPTSGQHRDHWILPEEERQKGFVRPVRRSYKHLTCGQETTMPLAIAETYARNPHYYGATFCCTCRDYFPVGSGGDFVWLDDGTKVGT